ncbi:MAG: carboxy terminal-processing peptidase, partial [Ginsengibacter sp.]
MDLRSTGGGSLTDVVEMVGLFIKNGPVVQVKGRNEKIQVLSDDDSNLLYSGPLTVMVDELSASASEIFAAAIQDYKRGIIIGSTSTYGKGTVQRPISLDPQSQNVLFSSSPQGLGDVKLTFRKFYRINGGTTQKIGVIPDIIVPDRLENVKFREKDNPYSLGWDTIAKANYRRWNLDITPIVKQVNQQIALDPNFTGIRETTNKLEKYNNQEAPLNIVEYKKMKNQVRNLSKELDQFSKLKDTLHVKSLKKDMIELGDDKEKIKKQDQFIKVISGDKYIDETMKVMNKMIENEKSTIPTEASKN